MPRWRGRSSTRRKTLKRNLAKRRELAAHPSGTGSGTGVIDKPPEPPPVRVGVRKRRPTILSDWGKLADDLLRGALRVSGLSRGVLALQVPTERPGRFRVERQAGFAAGQGDRLQTILGVLGDTLRTRKQRAASGETLKRPTLGAVMAIPLSVNGTLIGALILEDDKRSTAPAWADLSRVGEFAQHLANVLAHRLNDLRPPPSF